MSYYATADGNIKLKNRLSEKRLEELIDILRPPLIISPKNIKDMV